MPEHDLEKLLGGFAANTLTPEERSQLYTASLQDQQLFNALADEQALKELLSDPAVRRKLLEALKRPNTAEAGGSLPWWAWFKRPAGLAFAGGLAAVIFALAFGTRIYQESLDHGSKRKHRSNRPSENDPRRRRRNNTLPPKLHATMPCRYASEMNLGNRPKLPSRQRAR